MEGFEVCDLGEQKVSQPAPEERKLDAEIAISICGLHILFVKDFLLPPKHTNTVYFLQTLRKQPRGSQGDGWSSLMLLERKEKDGQR